MSTLAVIGAQWGDEGKGKITDYLALKADLVVRFQGGDNAGHTIVFGKEKYALHLVPSGIFRPDTKNLLAAGMVINPLSLLEEIDMLKEKGFDCENLVICARAHVILPYHQALDTFYESLKKDKVGTTAKGIGPAYMDKAARRGIRIGEFCDPARFAAHLSVVLPHINFLLESAGMETFDKTDLVERFKPVQDRLRPYVGDGAAVVNDAIDKDLKVLFEGAQGTMLCLDHGTYPYVTSSSPTAAAIPINVGIPPKAVHKVLGITKAYATRVGGGVFPSEISGDTADSIRQNGNEFGTTTGRPRRIGWLDTVALRHAVRINGFDYLAIMLLDVLSGVDELKLCTAYELDGERIDHVPASIDDLKRCRPVLNRMPGFTGDISSAKTFEDLPQNARNYLEEIARLVGVGIALFSVGPGRDQTVLLDTFF